MSKKDIHKIDNYLIRVGIIWIFFLFCYGACGGNGLGYLMLSCADPDERLFVVTQGGRTETFTSDATLSEIYEQSPGAEVEIFTPDSVEPIFEGVNPLWVWTPWLLLFIGFSIRREEDKVIEVWNALERTGEIGISELSNNTGHPRDFLLKAVHIINAHSEQRYHVDERHSIIHRISSDDLLFYIEKCNNCGASVASQIRLSKIKPATCPYCQFALITDEMVEHAYEVNRFKAPQKEPEKPFSAIIFMLLITCFPPFGIAYAVYKTGLLKRL